MTGPTQRAIDEAAKGMKLPADAKPAYHLGVPPWREGTPEWVRAQKAFDAKKRSTP